ncbi:hypothetical protein BT93_L1355 [Corymbia citriodora subsp. variegata]|uniref:UBX domain-containing protein n=1 Tax=Corymbia citriodora subsp. variegata TaxID=360336 RepID=A0A8T0CEG2_CORYI|nr:hypothetical protein BT93_L1355 [Corymbia citriodora subsp. variegata]
MYTGDWEEARQEGKDEKKWLLVNIQNEKVFDCQVLNRDIWKNESIIETVKENFLFLQYSKDDPRAETYCNYYFQNAQIEDEYPHVAVVDPRTGEQVKLWSKKVPQQAEFLMQLHEFLDRYSLETSARNPVAKRRSEAKKEKPVEQLTEDEQIERAMQASLGGRKESIKVPNEDPDDLTKSIPDLRNSSADDKDMTDVSEEETSSSSQTSPFASIPSDQPHKEPEMSSSVTRIQLRHPAGRIVRRFAIADPVQRIYEYLKAEPIEGKEGADFELRSLGKDLIDSRDSTIEEAGLKNASVMVEFVDT